MVEWSRELYLNPSSHVANNSGMFFKVAEHSFASGQPVSGNSRDGECFNLDKQTWWWKSQGTQETISQNLLIKIVWYLEEFLLLSDFK